MVDTTRRISLWIIGTVTGICMIGLIGIFFMASVPAWVHPCSNRMN
ncbi:hypothetical protein NC653_036655 [Populus alba x Populus x berolinensis]|uniref:Uncharacterized protein n=1 Tax=Populus alba x Populus x berolinensis TaxID=444605 RepID=A0AAD6PV67_9ROSI|nr:hypothetical protein NC653_036655 [Populus alba x Populus x berolinensis]